MSSQSSQAFDSVNLLDEIKATTDLIGAPAMAPITLFSRDNGPCS
jgi:hypothetical protein